MYNNPFTDLKDAYCPNLICVSVRVAMCNNNVTNNVSETQNMVVFVYFCTQFYCGRSLLTTNCL